MKYKKSSNTQGAWIKKDEVDSGSICKIVSETEPKEGEYGIQNVTKLRIKGAEDSLNMNINKTTINGLIEAFGEDSKDWIGKELVFYKEKQTISGKRQVAVYLIPQEFELTEDENGYIIILPIGGKKVVEKTKEANEELDISDIPF